MKKVLFFTYDFPYPTNSGGKNRAYNLMKYGGIGFDIILFSFTRGPISEVQIDALKKIGVKKIYTFQRKKVLHLSNIKTFISQHSIFRELYYDEVIKNKLLEVVEEEKIDIVHCESYYTFFYLTSELKKRNAKLIAGSENIEIDVYEKYIVGLKYFWLLKPALQGQLDKIRTEEENAFKNSDANIAVSKKDAFYINSLGGKKCYIVENGVDINHFKFKPKTQGKIKNILFVGNFSYFPNRSAVESFYKNVFSQLTPNKYKFTLVGKNSRKLYFSRDQGVECIEFIEDVRSAYYDADVSVFPIRYGGGTSYKILESMATGVPIISYDYKMEALDARPDAHYLSANDNKGMLDELERLFGDDKVRITIINNARKLVEERYSWEVVGKKMNEVWKNL